MKIHGLQKMTLLDFPGRVACTVFLGGCGFRCPFCHNYELVDGSAPPVTDDKEFFDFLSKRKGLLDGVAITGGEPCMRPDLRDFIVRIRELGFPVKLDTNGAHPDVLGDLLADGLVDYVAMDIKNSPVKYAATVGLDSFDISPVLRSVSLLMSSGTDYEFRTTVVDELHEPEDFEPIGELVKGARLYFLQSFTDRDSVPFAGLHAPSEQKMNDIASVLRRCVKDVRVR